MFLQQQTHVYVNIQQVLYITELLLIIFQLFRYQLHHSTHFLLAGILGNPVTSLERDNDTRSHNTELTEIIAQPPAFDNPFYFIPSYLFHILLLLSSITPKHIIRYR